MGKRLEYTPRSKVRSALRQLFLRSRERAKALKATGYCCAECGIKQSKAKGKEVKIEVHHIEGARLEELIDLVYKWLLCDPAKLKPLCEKCHDAHKNDTPTFIDPEILKACKDAGNALHRKMDQDFVDVAKQFCSKCNHLLSEHNSHGCQHDYNDGSFACPCGGE